MWPKLPSFNKRRRPVNLSTRQPVNLSASRPVKLLTCQPVELSTCRPVHLTITNYTRNVIALSIINIYSAYYAYKWYSFFFIHATTLHCFIISNVSFFIFHLFIYLLIYLLMTNIICVGWQVYYHIIPLSSESGLVTHVNNVSISYLLSKVYKGDLFIEIQIRSILLQFTVSWICRIFLIIRLSNWGIKYHVKNSFNCNIVSPYISTLTIKLHKNSVVFCPNIVLIGRFAGQTRLD